MQFFLNRSLYRQTSRFIEMFETIMYLTNGLKTHVLLIETNNMLTHCFFLE